MRFEVIDAFTRTRFEGNPAAVVVFAPKDARFSDVTLLQKLACEFNLSETAYNIPSEEESTELHPHYKLRWFTPTLEIKLCGHATLASAFSLFTHEHPTATRISFSTLSGTLITERTPGGSISLDLPACPLILDSLSNLDADYIAEMKRVAGEVSSLLQGRIVAVANGSMGPVVELEVGADLEGLVLDHLALTRNGVASMTFTQPSPLSSKFDIYSRFLGPGLGVNEDPVTGSAHAYLGPYWLGTPARGRLSQVPPEGVDIIRARQVGPRKGEMEVVWKREEKRVTLVGQAVSVAEGTFNF